MLLMVEKGTRGEICHVIHKYAKANNKYTKNYDKIIKSSYLMYLDVFVWMGKVSKPPENGFKWKKKVSKFDEYLIKNYDEDRDKRYILEIDVEYPKDLHGFHNDLPFLEEMMKIKKFNQLACNVYGKKEYVVHIRALKQPFNHSIMDQ